MAKTAQDVMTADPQCCAADTPLNEVAKLMVDCDCGEIPIVDADEKLVGVVTDRDIVTRVVANGLDPRAVSARDAMSQPVVSARKDASLDDVIRTMEEHQIRRVPVVDEDGCCCGIVAQADVALSAHDSAVGELVREVSH